MMITILNKKPSLSFLSAALVLFALTGCEKVDVDDQGRISEEAVRQFARFEGTYQGRYIREYANSGSRNLGELTVQIRTVDRAPTLTASMDMTGYPECKSAVGPLTGLALWDKDGSEYRGKFAFNPGTQKCLSRFDGRSLDFAVVLHSDGEIKLTTRILQERRQIPRSGRAPGIKSEETVLMGRLKKI